MAMRLYRRIGLILIYFLAVSHTAFSSADDRDVDNSYDYSYEDGEEEEQYRAHNEFPQPKSLQLEGASIHHHLHPHPTLDQSSTAPTTTLSTNSSSTSSSPSSTSTTPVPTISSTTIQQNHHHDSEPPLCPEPCQCSTDEHHHLLVNCSGRSLTAIPAHMPKHAYAIDLSDNQIAKLAVSDLAGLFPNLTDLNLAHNDLSVDSLTAETFHDLPALEFLRLSDNQLDSIPVDAFSGLPGLRQLLLDRNPIQLPKEGPFLNQPGLEGLHMQGCNVTNDDLQVDLFTKLDSLKLLNLWDNLLSGPLDTEPFKPLLGLTSLRLPEVEKYSIEGLCRVLRSIDLIDISSNWSVSCFELTSGLTYEESIITHKPLATIPVVTPQDSAEPDWKEIPEEDSPPEPDGSEDGYDDENPANDEETSESRDALPLQNEKPVTRASEIVPFAKDASKATESKMDGIEEPIPLDEEVIENGTQAGGASKGFDLATIPTSTINNILLGLIIVAVVGIVIGVIFRRDVGGIKTKMCRTRRQQPSDQIRPAEEVPLNKV